MPETNLFDPEEAIAYCEKLKDDLDDLVRRVENGELPDGAEDFATEVKVKVEDMSDWIDVNSRVTDRMATALENIRGGTDRWQGRGR